ncbi:NmrA-like family-domain-containing protein [Thamnocephalis sphaerospora]|uniref:NmrA-like family-domain-containing protein n=1 Tax=Thamnocephalis sphaerospora TaxID=78915 RepID=A0A4P9XFU0_9FUNG|nr:NmrA-like family-domain-containing protein [Thamnocephalis sphaerospora]|eukprot:RKP04454.1 NmrA-like family-domain-containing protein [Thamnocephalis sphaerospora]
MTLLNILIAGGTGRFGGMLVDALLADGAYKVGVLSRIGTQSKALDSLRERGVHIVHVDYDSHVSLVEAMQGTDTLVCTLDYGSAVKLQDALFRAAKDAGVSRVVPSEYGPDSPGMLQLMYEDPASMERSIKDLQLEYTRYFAGNFYEYLTSPEGGIDIPLRNALVFGNIDVPMAAIRGRDVARFMAASLKDPRSRNASLRFQSEAITYRQLIDAIEKRIGDRLNIEHVLSDVPVADQYAVDASLREQIQQFDLVVERGDAVLTGVDNAMFPCVKCSTLRDYLKDTLPRT